MVVMSSLARAQPQGIAACGLATYSINYQGLTPTTRLHSIIRYLGQRTTSGILCHQFLVILPNATQGFPWVDNMRKQNIRSYSTLGYVG